MRIQRIVILIASVLGILSVFLPWVSISAFGVSASLNGINLGEVLKGYGWVGPLVIAIFAIPMVISIAGDRSRPIIGSFKFVSAVAGAISALSVVALISYIYNELSVAGPFQDAAMDAVFSIMGSGLYTLFIAGVGVCAASLVSKNKMTMNVPSLSNDQQGPENVPSLSNDQQGPETELTASQIKKRRNLYLSVSAVALLVLGLIYAWSIFSGPLSAHTGFTRGDLQITFTISMIFFCLSMLAGAFINRVLSIRGTLMVAAVLLAVGFAGTAMFGQAHIGVIYVCYGVLSASACGIGYNTVVSRVGIWFPDKTGFASGVMMMGFGLGGLILGTVAAKMITGIGIQTTFYILAVIGFIFMSILASLIKPAPSNIVREMAPQKLAAGSSDKPTVKDGYIYTAPILIAYSIFGICAIAAGLTLIGSAKPGMEAVGGAEWAGFATIFVGLVSTMNGISRLIVGTIFDKTNLITALFVVAIIGLMASSSLAVAYATSTPILYIIGGLCLGFSYGGIPVVAAAFAREGFGAKNYPTNLAVVNLTIAFGSFLSQGVISVAGPDGTATHPSVWLAVVGVSSVALIGVVIFTLMYRVYLKK